MRYSKIRKMDISNGPGVRVSLFVQGCEFHCKECFNPETHDFSGGRDFTPEKFARVLELCGNENIVGLSILGGEPMHPANIEEVTKLAQQFKEKYPAKSLWAWTGYRFENDIKDKEICNYLDVLVDGPYVDQQRNPRLKWRGSSNQRVIDVPKSMARGEVVLLEE